MTTHLHASTSDRDYCDTVCGLRCDTVDTAYSGLDPERVTCTDCVPSGIPAAPRGATYRNRHTGRVITITVGAMSERNLYAYADSSGDVYRPTYGLEGRDGTTFEPRDWTRVTDPTH